MVVGSVSDPVGEIVSFLRERGVAARSITLDSPRQSLADVSSSISFPLAGNSPAKGVTSKDQVSPLAEALPEDASWGSVAVCWSASARRLAELCEDDFPSTVVVVGPTKQDVVAACVEIEADYAVLWPKEKDLLETLVRVEMGQGAGSLGSGPAKVAVGSVRSAGGTLLAANLTAELSSRGMRICVVDCDSRHGELADLLLGEHAPSSGGASRFTEGAVSALYSDDSIDSPREPRSAPGENPALVGGVPDLAETVLSYRAGSLWELETLFVTGQDGEALLRRHDCVVVDVPSELLETACPRTAPREGGVLDAFLLVVPVDYFGLRRARALLGLLDDSEFIAGKAAVVLCPSRRSGPAPLEAVKLLGDRVAFEMPRAAEEAAGAIDEGRLLAPSDRSPIGRAVAGIGDWIVETFALDSKPRGTSRPTRRKVSFTEGFLWR